ncbi:MAG: hypothetical protein [Bacteriophage sp.]|nr:MAG: hypothetical protein [Bacteriophage sp.]
MDLDFGYDPSKTGNNTGEGNENGNGGTSTDITTGKVNTDTNEVPADDINDNNGDGNKGDSNKDNGNKNDNNGDDNKNTNLENHLEAGTSIEVGENTYTVDEQGNLVDKDGNIFKEAKDVDAWLKEFDKIENTEDEININTIQDAIGIQITDDNDKPIEFENSIEGIKSYINAVVETARDEHYETAINTLYQKYPILNDVLNYYLANGNSLEGFNEIPDRSGITINDFDEAQQEAIIRTAWKEQGRKGDVESYLQYLKSSGTLLATAKEELAGLQEADAQYRKEIEEEAERKENERIKRLEDYWNGVHDVIKSRNIAGYQIPETIVINRDGQKISVTPEDFFNYVYRVDNDGLSAYERALAAETPESRRDDEILRAYLKFVGGNYSNLVSMAINKEKVATLRLKAKERNTTTVRVTKPQQTGVKGTDIDFGYN